MVEKTIVHISADFPDALRPMKTSSVSKLISGAHGFRHIVYSLNRVSWTSRIASLDFGPDRTAVAYGAPPKGLWLATRLERVADWILEDIRRRQLSVDALHLHKFTIEGLVGLKLARILKCRFVVNVWGDTDLKIVRARPDLMEQWRAILSESSLIIFLAPWTLESLDALFGLDRRKTTIIPSIVQNDEFAPSQVVADNRFISIFNLDFYRRKNFSAVIRAIRTLRKLYPSIRLDVYGRGSPRTILSLDNEIASAGVSENIYLKGPLAANLFSKTLTDYVALLLPSKRETFGMVFIEALFSGLPLLYSKGWGIDGFFRPESIGYACDSAKVGDIRLGIELLINDQKKLKESIASLHANGEFEIFKEQNIREKYRNAMTRLIET